MKEKIKKKLFIILLLIFQLIQLTGNIIPVKATIKEGDTVVLKADHECNALLQFYMPQYDFWSYKEVWYVCYQDKEDGNKYPAFCIEPSKNGIGITYPSYDVIIKNEIDSRIWRILNKGYMGSSWKEWNIENDDDFYYATKVAIHSLIEGIEPKNKYILGNRSVDSNTVDEIQRRGKKVIDIAQILYEYGLNGTDTYQPPKINIVTIQEGKTEIIEENEYYVQNYIVNSNKTLKSYDVEIQNFPNETKILNSENQEQTNFEINSFKIAIPINKIKEDIIGKINIKNALVKTNPIYLCQSGSESTQNYVTYMSGYEKTQAEIELDLKTNASSLEILKIDSDTKEPIPNVIFQIKDENGEELAKVTTNDNGIAVLENIYPQKVTIKEIKVPEKYVLSEEEKQVQLEWQKKTSITFENELKKGNLKVVKVDADNKKIKLANVEFDLLNDENEKIQTIITDENGEAYISNLKIGNYTIKEVKTLENYVLSQDRQIEIEYNKTTEIVIENEKQKENKPKLPRTGF